MTAIVMAQQGQDWSREQIETIRATVAKGASDSQLALFLEICRRRGLDPFAKQVHWTSQGTICGIDGFRAIADRSGAYVPGPTAYECDGEKLVAAHVTVKKLVAGGWHEITESAYLAEYQGGSPIWKKMPRVMLAKCAEARALRRAFPADLSGLYAPEEMDQATTPAPPPERDVTPLRAVRAEVVEPPPAPWVEDAPPALEAPAPVRTLAFRTLAAEIEKARSQDDLNAVAKRIGRARDAGEFEAGEKDALGALYVAKKAAVR